MFSHSPSGLYLTKNRAYDPYSGRWLSRDPKNETGGINLYAYVDDDPTTGIDPLGLLACQLSGSALVGDAQANATNSVSTHQCATAVRQDFNEASGGNGSSYIPYLGAGGTPAFNTVGSALINSGCYVAAPQNYTPQPADVEITEGAGTSHISIDTGQGWASDYTSKNANPGGTGYANSTTQYYEYIGPK
jgi:uncharacterized protein RhaS with RHS repeats